MCYNARHPVVLETRHAAYRLGHREPAAEDHSQLGECLKPTAVPSQALESVPQRPTARSMLRLWLPLAASIVMMVLEPSIINIGLGRTRDPELALAAYGVAFSLALLVEAPIIMLLDASVARSVDRQAFALIRRFTMALGLVVTAIGLGVSLTPLYGLLVEKVMNIPPDVAARARPTLQVLSLWPLPIAWRRVHQGVLIRTGNTGIITLTTGIRLATLAGGLSGGLYLLPDRGALVAGLAMDLSVVVESFLVTLATRSVLVSPDFQRGDPSAQRPLTWRDLWRFYRPLLATTILRQTARPLLNAGIAAAAMARASLAAWPVAWGLAILISGPAWSIQQLTTAVAVDKHATRQVWRFSLALCVFFAILLAIAAFTPLYGLIMGGIYNLSTDLQVLARPATQLLVLLPLLMGTQSVYRGVLIRAGSTSTVRSAMLVNVATTAATLLVGVTWVAPTGVLLASVATLTGGLGELLLLISRT